MCIFSAILVYLVSKICLNEIYVKYMPICKYNIVTYVTTVCYLTELVAESEQTMVAGEMFLSSKPSKN